MILRSALFLFLVSIILLSCRKEENTSTPTPPGGGTYNSDPYDVDGHGIPKFVGIDYMELSKIYRISRFRSGEGHDYSDSFESCRSMKHYFNPKSTVNWGSIKIFAPVTGTVSRMFDEWAGTQVQIRSSEYPAFFFIIFHINLTDSLRVGDTVRAGQQLGLHIGSQTMSDVAVGVNTPSGWKLVSYFDTMTDSLFQTYVSRGVGSRSDLIISKAARDADSLSCSGQTFTTTGSIGNWVNLN